MASANKAAYVAAKHGILRVTKVVALETVTLVPAVIALAGSFIGVTY